MKTSVKSKASKPPKSAKPAPRASSAPSALSRLQYAQKRVPLDNIHKSASVQNPRTAFDTPADAELRDSIKAHGILSDLWVRPARGRNSFELIAGERRWRAAQAAGIADAPVKIWLACDDNSARELQIIENLQRTDITALEEGRAFKRLRDECGYSVEPDPKHPDKPSIMQSFSVSKSYAHGRIKLVDLPKLGLEALESGKLSASVAVRVARIPGPKRQLECLRDVMRSGYGDSGPMSDKQAAAHIERNYMKQLKGAPFDPSDATLVPVQIENHQRVAGGACGDCPFRSGNQPDLFERGRADVCTNPACFTLKEQAAWKRVEAKAKAEDCAVIPPDEAGGIFTYDDKLPFGSRYVLPSDRIPEDPKKRTYGALAAECGLKPTLVRSDRTRKTHKLFVRSECKEAFIKAGHKFYEEKSEQRREDNAGQIIAARQRALAEISWEFRLGALVDAIAAAESVDAPVHYVVASTLGFARNHHGNEVAAALVRRIPLRDKRRVSALFEAYAASLRVQAVAALTCELAIRILRDTGNDDVAIAMLAKHYGVDLDRIERDANGQREAFRQAKQSMGFAVDREVLIEARKACSADRIAEGRPVLTFEHRGLTFTVTSNEPLIAWEMVPLAAYDGKARDYNAAAAQMQGFSYEGIKVRKQGIEYALRGPALQLVARPGQCVKCGCTELEACEGGCSWADESKTVCSKCESPVGKPAAANGEHPSKPTNENAGKLTPEGRARLAARMKARWEARKKLLAEKAK